MRRGHATTALLLSLALGGATNAGAPAGHVPTVDGAPRWNPLGPDNASGRVNALVPLPRGRLLAGTDGGGLWESADNGRHWKRLPMHHSHRGAVEFSSVGALAAAPSDPRTLYAGTGTGGFAVGSLSGVGLAVSRDGGATWSSPQPKLITNSFIAISVHPKNPGEVVVSSYSGTFKLTAFGAHTAASTPGLLHQLVRDPQDPQRLYGVLHGVLQRSLDGGATWAALSGPKQVPAKQPIETLALNPLKPRQLFALGQDAKNVTWTLRSDDGGDTWQLVGQTTIPGGRNGSLGHSLVIDPAHPQHLFAGGVGYARSHDGGKTWSLPPMKDVHADLRDARYHGGELLLATDGGVFATHDLGQTAHARNGGLVNTQLYAMASEPQMNHRLFITTQDNGIWRRPDAGGRAFTSMGGGDGFLACLVDPSKKNTFYFSSAPGSWGAAGMLHRTDASGAAQTKPKRIDPPGEDGSTIGPLIALAHRRPKGGAQVSLLFGDRWVQRSQDSGAHWTRLPGPAEALVATVGAKKSAYEVTALAAVEHGNAPAALLVAKGAQLEPASAIYHSSDEGKTWAKASGAPKHFISSVAFDPHDAKRAYAATYDPDGPPIYCSVDGAKSFAPCSSGLAPGRFGRAVRVDLLDSAIVYAGTDLGLFRSTDHGAHWARYGHGMETCPISGLELLPGGIVLRAATYGCGAWELLVRKRH